MQCGYINARSLNNKSDIIRDIVEEFDFDILAISETWLSKEADKNQQIIEDIKPVGYSFFHVPRGEGRGGGVGVLYKTGIKFRDTLCQSKKYETFEHLECVLNHGHQAVRLMVIYRPPSQSRNNSSDKKFMSEFSTMLTSQLILPGKLLICGDINYHMDIKTNRNTMKLHDLMKNAGIEQHVNEPTHEAGHILDIVLGRDTEDMITEVSVSEIQISDHHLITFELDVSRPPPQLQHVSYRSYRKIDKDRFRKDLEESLQIDENDTVEEMLTKYTSITKTLIDKHAPEKSKLITKHPNTPWYTEELRAEKHKRRKLERKWRSTRKAEDKEAYKEQCKAVNKLVDSTKTWYYSNKLTEVTGNQKQVYNIINRLLHRTNKQILPQRDSLSNLCDEFADFFADKIVKIREELERNLLNMNLANTNVSADTHNVTVFDTFKMVTEEEVEELVISTANKSCELDILPTWLLKDNLDAVLPILTSIINCSLSTSHVPADFKKALLKPLIKKAMLDPEIMKNYRPVSNLDFISKLLERVVAKQLENHLTMNDLYEILQSAYRKHHSTESALLKVNNDILKAINEDKVCLLVLLDLSAAFDTIDHQMLLERLHQDFHITGSVLKWITSYLLERKQKVAISNETSSEKNLDFGVPQGSVLGPVLFTLYTAPLASVINRYSVS